ncbi:MAG: lamin tail domain-containing protein, partial [Bacteroidales bacterium]|nr:lamin tail domain-containing protein [Bacteroidales bacterium]
FYVYSVDDDGNEELECSCSLATENLSQMTETGVYCKYTKTRSQANFIFDSYELKFSDKTPEIVEPEKPIEPEPEEPEVEVKRVINRGDVVISEIMANPTAGGILPNAEYVEVYNRTDSVIYLNQWTVETLAKSGKIADTYLYPHTYLLLVASSKAPLFAEYENVAEVASPFAYNSLTNSGTTLVLRDDIGRVIDAMTYKSAEKDISIERIDLDNLSLSADNQINSISSVGGTPCAENSVKAENGDGTSPKFEIELNSSCDTLIITFDEPIDTAKFERVADFNGERIKLTLLSFDEVMLNRFEMLLSKPVAAFGTYSLYGISDLNGNVTICNNENYGEIPTEYLDVTYRGCLVINEVMAKPSDDWGLPNYEYVELYNASDKAVNLKSWTLSTSTKTGVMPEFLLGSGEYVVLVSSSAVQSFSEFGSAVALSSWSATAITNASCELTLTDPSGRIIDFFPYESSLLSTEKQVGGWSLERVSPYNLSLSETNYRASVSDDGGTPCMQNSVYSDEVDMDNPRVVSAILTDSVLTIVYSEPIDTLSIYSSVKLNGTNVSVELVGCDAKTQKTFVFKINDEVRRGVTYQLRLPSVDDLAGNASSEVVLSVGICEAAEVGDAIIINEVMSAANPAKADFVELYNNTPKIIDLSTLAFAKCSNGVVTAYNVISNQQKPMFPCDYVVITADSSLVVETYEVAHVENVVQMAKFPALSADEGEIAITTTSGDILDYLAYSKQMHNPLMRSAHENVSLERISLTAPTNEVSNWTSASALSNYATPTARNSQNRDSVVASVSEVTIAKRIFTPDGDGIDDELIVNTTFTDGLWFATMRIFTSSGDEVVCVYNNETLPATGEMLWNGRNANGELMRPGTYIVFISAWQTGGKTKEFKKTCVIGVTK